MVIVDEALHFAVNMDGTPPSLTRTCTEGSSHMKKVLPADQMGRCAADIDDLPLPLLSSFEVVFLPSASQQGDAEHRAFRFGYTSTTYSTTTII